MTGGVQIDSMAIYDDGALYCALGLSSAALARARRAGRLRYTRQGSRVLYLGEWVMEWLRGTADRQELSSGER
jgi:hypothetical protein